MVLTSKKDDELQRQLAEITLAMKEYADAHLDGLNAKINELESRVEELESQVEALETDNAELRDARISREDFFDTVNNM